MADAAGLHADQNFAGADRRRVDGVDRNDGVAAIDGGLHVIGDNPGIVRSCGGKEISQFFRCQCGALLQTN